MSLATLVSPTRTEPVDYYVESATEHPKVLIFDNADMWNFYLKVLRGIVPPNDTALTQFLTEAERTAGQKGPFDAYVINLDRVSGTEYGLQNGVDLADIIVNRGENRESMWFLSRTFLNLNDAKKRRFTRLYEILEQPKVYLSIDRFVQDLRQELTYGRRGI